MDRAAKIPGPGEYDVRPKSTGVVVQIGETAPPSFLDLVTRKAAETPVSYRKAGGTHARAS